MKKIIFALIMLSFAVSAFGADVNAKYEGGETALIAAVRRWEYPSDVIPALIEAGADIKAKDSENKTASDYFEENEPLKISDEYQGNKIRELLKGKS